MSAWEQEIATEDDARSAVKRLLEVAGASFEERAHLQRALDTRVVIEQAKGMLAERLRLSIDDAFAVLRAGARSTGTKLHDLARRVLDEPETPAEVIAALNDRLTRHAGE